METIIDYKQLPSIINLMHFNVYDINSLMDFSIQWKILSFDTAIKKNLWTNKQ